jgi:hypothetical protein
MSKQAAHNQVIEFLNASYFKGFWLVQVRISLSTTPKPEKSWKQKDLTWVFTVCIYATISFTNSLLQYISEV